MTKEEHIARAMLLDLTYAPRGHYYVTLTGINKGPFRRLDADTLKPLTLQDAIDRQKEARFLRYIK